MFPEGPLNPLPLPAGCGEDATALAQHQCLLSAAGASSHGSSSNSGGGGGGNGRWNAKQKHQKLAASSDKSVPAMHSITSPPPLSQPLKSEGNSKGKGLLAEIVLPI